MEAYTFLPGRFSEGIHPCLSECLSLLQDISEFQILGHNLMQLLDLAMLY